jgi:hypothetical protein
MAGTMVLQRLGRGLGALVLVASVAARAENLDAGKSGAKLFSDSCVTCHHSARGLAKGRFSVTLYFFLQQHYASNSSSAWALTSYLESLDEAPRSRSQPTRTKPASSTATSKPVSSNLTPQSSLRPPLSVPQR